MKYNIKILKEKIVSFFKSIKNKILPFITKNKIVPVALGIFLIIIIGILIGNCKDKKTHVLTGNLNSLGFTTKVSNWVYYLGYNDGNIDGIYRVKNNKKEKISDEYGYYLNNDGKYIYYVDSKTNDLIKMKKNGKDKQVFVEKVDSFKITISDNWLYYLKGAKLYRVKTNGNKKREILNKSIKNYEIIGDLIYYSYFNNDKYIISKMTTDGKNVSKISSNDGKVFFINNNEIYYIIEKYNEEDSKNVFGLYKMKLNGKNEQKITEIVGNINTNSINFYKNYMYYTKLDEDNKLAIYKIKLNGKKETKVTDIKAYSTLININDKYLYYPDENDEGNMQLFRIKTDGKQRENLSL